MLKVHDIRETRVYQEGVEEGRQEGEVKGKEEGKEEGIEIGIEKAIAITKLADKKMPAAEIAAKLELDIALVRKVIAAAAPKKRRK
jgi:predicted transposase YdaD